ncbi:GATOR complex protein DEPDC5-like [Paramacrobiotus metropolitanus]|uniref:GATOR complex protein DEPDC5-like n=1 Tax=Paramacrobiotus metropolitanus TaxID=2943436 RepID=UPI002445EB1B|nr:GATOR complex protein DEPDC5-like [Paramacrobiotus metropolitanus]
MKPPKLFKLQIHSRSTASRHGHADEHKELEDLYLNPRDHPDLKTGDIVEIYDQEDSFSRLLLQVKQRSLKDDAPHNGVSVEESIAKTFQLRAYRDVVVNSVAFKDVELDLLELTVKDQYFSRSDMWRYRNALVGSCVQLFRKIEHGFGRTTVHEMWVKGTRVASGTIGENTRIVYRSLTANVFIFIQLSVEMWEFDFYGDLYFEKSVKGFLTDLLDRWRDQNANHDVTIVLFSRTFYEATTLDDFPCAMREGLLRDYKGRFYEDFYRIVVQNEKYDDWRFVLVKLKTLFHEYNESVLNFHAHPGVKLPRAYNSTAAEGNVLEVLNMGLNVFEKHTTDRNFERTGQMCVVITPSTGVFEVDRELLTLTKQKSIDYGIGNDLVFMGEQPLHVVPLFVLHNKQRNANHTGDEPAVYAIPNWLNYSYYTSKGANPHTFVPRIRISEKTLQAVQNKPFFDTSSISDGPGRLDGDDGWTPRNRPIAGKRPRSRVKTERRLSESTAVSVIYEETAADLHLSGEAHEKYPMLLSASLETANPLRPNALGSGSRSIENLNLERSAEPKRRTNKSPNPRSLINPLAPSKIPVKLTSNRRRWVHIFPTDPSGAAVQTHHRRATSHSEDVSDLSKEVLSKSPISESLRDTDSPHLKPRRQDAAETDRISSWVSSGDPDDNSIADDDSTAIDSIRSPRHNPNGWTKEDIGRGSPAPSGSQIWSAEPKKKASTSKNYVWGITGEMEWTPNLTTGVDWKALTIPASLPITTDYLPDRRTLQNDYLISDYSVIPEEGAGWSEASNRGNRDMYDNSRYCSRPLALKELYEELVCQRLQQGFQLIIPRKNMKPDDVPTIAGKLAGHKGPQQNMQRPTITYLSLGRVIHELTLYQSSITVTRFTPRHLYRIPCVKYQYRFMVPDMMSYRVSLVEFSHERLENFNWNYMDFCVLTKGRGEFTLDSIMKYWKGQYYLLPCNPAVKKIAEDSDPNSDCCKFESMPCDELCEGFVRIMEVVNRIKRPSKSNRRAESTIKRPAIATMKPLHKGANPAAMSTPDLQSASGTPKSDSPISYYACLEQLKQVSHTPSPDTVSAEAQSLGSPVRTAPPTVKTSLTNILDAMKQTTFNVIIPKQPDLPVNCFLSYEAVDWAIDNLLIHTKEAICLFSQMLREGLIVHACGDPNFPFISGFYLYCVVDHKAPNTGFDAANSDVEFSQVWIECALLNCDKERPSAHANSPAIPEYLKPDPKFNTLQVDLPDYPLHKKKSSVIDVDMNHKSDRLEWAVANYHHTFTPKCAFEIELKWIQASGPMFGDMIQFWARKCPASGFHLVPVPVDPFALPYKANSDPLRMPIFVPLEWQVLTSETVLFHDCPEESRYLRTVLFQELILQKFGFIHLQDNAKRTNVASQSREYVHTTGGMFVMIPAQNNVELGDTGSTTEQAGAGDCGLPNNRTEIGFWWAWNSCLTKKWRTANTGDEAFLDKMLADFRSFCSNSDSRLRTLWQAGVNAASPRDSFMLSADDAQDRGLAVL